MKGYSDAQVEDIFRERFIDSYGYDPLEGPYEEDYEEEPEPLFDPDYIKRGERDWEW